MKHTKYALVALALIAAGSLVLSGCTTAAAPQAFSTEPATVAQAAAPTEETIDSSETGGYGWSADAERTAALGTGYRGNGGNGANGGYGGYGLETVDDCLPVYGDESAYPAYTPTAADLALSVSSYGSAGAAADTNLSLADMLTYATQDEYAARAEYELILEDYGTVRPFSNILRAEETHIDTLLPLFAEYGISAPADEGAARAALPDNLTSAYQTGVNAEVTNIAMYEQFLEQDLPADVRVVFESLMHASENHLRAFQNRL